jgi:hypothetical protein
MAQLSCANAPLGILYSSAMVGIDTWVAKPKSRKNAIKMKANVHYELIMHIFFGVARRFIRIAMRTLSFYKFPTRKKERGIKIPKLLHLNCYYLIVSLELNYSIPIRFFISAIIFFIGSGISRNRSLLN